MRRQLPDSHNYAADIPGAIHSDHVKLHLASANNDLVTTNYQHIALRFKRILDARPELGWVAPDGLRPLATLQVKNFRGFGALGSDDNGLLLRFSKIKNIFYAPNGGGKSSLCEALEYGTTGHIKEADRRKTKIRQYTTRNTKKVELTLMGVDRKRVPANLMWSSCFIDRNRLQEFSLLGSKDTNSAEGDVIAALFGLEEFQEVILRFVKPESFNLTSLRKQSQANAMQATDVDINALREQWRQHSENVAALNTDVCSRLGLEIHQQFAVRARLSRLTKLVGFKLRHAERLKVATLPFRAPMSQFTRGVRIARRLLVRKGNVDEALVQNVVAVSYRSVYQALQAIECNGAAEHCPACSTPLDRVVENPFEKARRELATLSELDQLKISRQRIEGRMVWLIVAIGNAIAAVDTNSRLGIPCSVALGMLRASYTDFHTATDRVKAATDVLTKVIELHEKDKAEIETYLNVCQLKHDAVTESDVQVKRLENEAEMLEQQIEDLRSLFDRKKTSLAARKEVSRQLAVLVMQRAAMKGNDADVVRFNDFIEQLQLEYGNFYRDLTEYKFKLEKARISGIESKAAEYYKAINHHDDDHERVDALSFEKSGENYRIKITSVDGSVMDAFSVLSEGHLRALGLSLLLAMAERNKFPLIVFDDVVNAIDSDHRSNIIDLFFADEYLRQTQMIITTHDRLFWERFCIIADRHPQAEQHTSRVLSYTNQGIVVVDHAGGFQEKVHRALAVYDIRQALVYCRIWFESMVLEYCIDNQVPVTAKFQKSSLKKNNYLQLSLEKTFALVEPHIVYVRSTLISLSRTW